MSMTMPPEPCRLQSRSHPSPERPPDLLPEPRPFAARRGLAPLAGAMLLFVLGCGEAPTPAAPGGNDPGGGLETRLDGATGKEPAGSAPTPERASAGKDIAEQVARDAEAMADLVRCEAPRPEVCTREFRPVCAIRDTGLRCVAPPCDEATERVTRPNGCDACTDPQVIGHRPGACDAQGPPPQTMLDY